MKESTTNLGHVVVDDPTDVRFVEAHAKCHSSHYDPVASCSHPYVKLLFYSYSYS